MRCSICIYNMWRTHVSSRRTVVEMYDILVQKGALNNDAGQKAMAKACTPLLKHISSLENMKLQNSEPLLFNNFPNIFTTHQPVKNAFRRLRGGLFPNKITQEMTIQFPENLGVASKTGIYMWGSVGIGKTLIMDLFELCETPGLTKRRIHLHSFMSDVVLRLQKAEIMARETHSYPIDLVVNDILKESPILCLDEFQTFDVTHAALLAGFFSRALPRGLIIFTTSNRPPEELTKISAAFDRFIPIIYHYCDIVHCGDIKDYRDNASNSHHNMLFLYPNNNKNVKELIHRVERGFKDKFNWIKDDTIWLYGRELVIPLHCGGVAFFDFSNICGPLGPPDFQCIAKNFHTVIITNIPQIGIVSKNAAQQFIILVDELYQYNVKLLFTSEVPWEHLLDTNENSETSSNNFWYSEGEDDRSGCSAHYNFHNSEEVLSFSRIASRLKEMGCRHYILRDHGHFLISDYNLAALLE